MADHHGDGLGQLLCPDVPVSGGSVSSLGGSLTPKVVVSCQFFKNFFSTSTILVGSTVRGGAVWWCYVLLVGCFLSACWVCFFFFLVFWFRCCCWGSGGGGGAQWLRLATSQKTIKCSTSIFISLTSFDLCPGHNDLELLVSQLLATDNWYTILVLFSVGPNSKTYLNSKFNNSNLLGYFLDTLSALHFTRYWRLLYNCSI